MRGGGVESKYFTDPSASEEEEDSWRVRLLINTRFLKETPQYSMVLAGGSGMALIAESWSSVIVLGAHAKSWS